MFTKQSFMTLFVLFLMQTVSPWEQFAWGNESADHFFDLGFQELSQIVVSSASKRDESFMEAPSAVYTISADDIKYSGAKKITDIFRMVPGMDVVDVNSFYSGVQSRGFSFMPKYAKQMLVLIDGMTVYTPQLNSTFWDQVPIFLENIDKVEVIKGPNAALYGSNAFNGVINISTKDPEKTSGGLVSITGGNRESLWSVARFGGDAGKLQYRVTAGYHETRGFSNVHDQVRKPQVTLRSDYRIDDRSGFSLRAGYVGGDRELAAQVDPEVTSFFVQARYQRKISDRGRLLLQYYHNYRNSGLTSFNNEDIIRQNDFEAQFNWDGDRHDLVLGAGYRFDRVKSGWCSTRDYRDYRREGPHGLHIPVRHNRTIKAFFNYTWHATEKLHLTAAMMVENNSFVGTKCSPKAALVYMPSKNHSFRISVARAYRTPSFVEEKGDFSVPLPFPTMYMGQQGNDGLDPERMVAFELGYRGLFLDKKLTVNIEAFYHNINNSIIYTEVSKRNVFEYVNYANNHVRGIEAFFIWRIRDWWRLTMNYACQEASDGYLGGLVVEQKAGLGSRFKMPQGFVANFQLYYVDRLHFKDEPFVLGSTVEDYARLDVRLSKTFFKQRMELALIGQNLLDSQHYEYPRHVFSVGEANRMFLLEFSYRFGM